MMVPLGKYIYMRLNRRLKEKFKRSSKLLKQVGWGWLPNYYKIGGGVNN